MKIHNTIQSLFCFSLLLGCSRQATPAATASTVPAPVKAPPAPDQPVDAEEGGTIAISEELRTICGIADEDAYFAFNSALLNPRATRVLKQVATCFDSGPLADRHLELVGRADPRGEDAYNMDLGERRADSVSRRLERLGLRGEMIGSSSRGERDAVGTNEASWADDRRVDVLLTPR